MAYVPPQVRFACPDCHASFQTAPAATAPVRVACAACGAEMQPAADVLDLHRVPTRRYDLHELQARLEQEREATAQPAPEPDQIWFAGVGGRRVGPLTLAGLEGLKARGQLAGTTLMWREGWPVWAAAEAVPELRPLLGLPPEPRTPEGPRLPDEAAPSGDEVTDPHQPAPRFDAPAGSRVRVRRADPQFSALSQPPRRAAGPRIAVAIAALGLALIFAGRACGRAPAPASASAQERSVP